MTETAEQAPEQQSDKLSEVCRAALTYAEHGWPVLPGSAWNGRRFVIPGTMHVTDGIRPSVPRNHATTEAAAITAWWDVTGRLVPSVLIRSGLSFDVVSAPRSIGERVVREEKFRRNAGPVIYRIDTGRMFFIVEPDERPSPNEPGGIELLRSGSWVVAPPTRVRGANVRWWVSPEYANWRPATLSVVWEALKLASRSRPFPELQGVNR